MHFHLNVIQSCNHGGHWLLCLPSRSLLKTELPHPPRCTGRPPPWPTKEEVMRLRWDSFFSLGFTTEIQNWDGKDNKFPHVLSSGSLSSGGSIPHQVFSSRVPLLTSPLPLPPTPSQWKKRNECNLWGPQLWDIHSDHRERPIHPQLLHLSPELRLGKRKDFTLPC